MSVYLHVTLEVSAAGLGRFLGAMSKTAVPFLEREGWLELPIRFEHAVRAGLLPMHHRDPFDRLLVAQAQALNLPILSADRGLDEYDVRRVW